MTAPSKSQDSTEFWEIFSKFETTYENFHQSKLAKQADEDNVVQATRSMQGAISAAPHQGDREVGRLRFKHPFIAMLFYLLLMISMSLNIMIFLRVYQIQRRLPFQHMSLSQHTQRRLSFQHMSLFQPHHKCLSLQRHLHTGRSYRKRLFQLRATRRRKRRKLNSSCVVKHAPTLKSSTKPSELLRRRRSPQ